MPLSGRRDRGTPVQALLVLDQDWVQQLSRMELPPPGTVISRDFRSQGAPAMPPTGPIKLLQFNIERGYQLPGIIEELRQVDADVLSLQEVDAGCERSGSVDTGVAIAEALGLNYAFLCEFEELRSPLRDARSQGGGVHGNAILSKFHIEDVAVVEHRLHPVDWDNPAHPLAKKEPRRGRRAVLRATLCTPQGPLVVYCAHLEVFCGMLARVCQLADIFEDSRRMIQRGFCHLAILGDLNTMAHGIARLSPNYCMDRMRFRSLGMDEAVVWEHYVLSQGDPAFDPGLDGSRGAVAGPVSAEGGAGGAGAAAAAAAAAAAQDAAAEATILSEELAEDAEAASVAAEAAAAGSSGAASQAVPAAPQSAAAQPASAPAPREPRGGGMGPNEQGGGGSGSTQQQSGAFNQTLVGWGLSEETARRALNPGFQDPFPAATTVTLDNPAYRWFGISLMRGKLDWVLLRRLRVHATAEGNGSYAISDHKWLSADVTLEQ